MLILLTHGEDSIQEWRPVDSPDALDADVQVAVKVPPLEADIDLRRLYEELEAVAPDVVSELIRRGRGENDVVRAGFELRPCIEDDVDPVDDHIELAEALGGRAVGYFVVEVVLEVELLSDDHFLALLISSSEVERPGACECPDSVAALAQERADLFGPPLHA